MGQLGDYFERLADDDRTWVLVIDPGNPELYHSLPRSETPHNERRREADARLLDEALWGATDAG